MVLLEQNFSLAEISWGCYTPKPPNIIIGIIGAHEVSDQRVGPAVHHRLAPECVHAMHHDISAPHNWPNRAAYDIHRKLRFLRLSFATHLLILKGSPKYLAMNYANY